MPINILAMLGDALWILTLASIASGATRLTRVLPPGVRLPMQWSVRGKPGWRATKPLALTVVIGVPLAVGLIMSAVARSPSLGPEGQLIVFLIRALAAPLHLLAHWGWMRATTRTLDAEGALKP